MNDTDDTSTADASALSILRRGVAATPELRTGAFVTIVFAFAAAAGRLVIPILIQQILDRGVRGPQGYRPNWVLAAAIVAAIVIVAVALISRITRNRLIRTAERSLCALRTAAFDHIHRLSVADHNETRRGTLTARVTSDVEQIARFIQWGALGWMISTAVIIGTVATMAIWSWQLTLVVLAVYVPALPYARFVQRSQLAAYDSLRDRVGNTLETTSELVMGAAVIRAYGHREPAREQALGVVGNHYRAQLRSQKYFALYLPATEIFGAVALGAALAVGVWWGPGWGMTAGELIGFAFLVNLLAQPISEISETLDLTQLALASWSKILDVLDQPVTVVEAEDGSVLPAGALDVEVRDLAFSYRVGPQVLHDVSVAIPAGCRAAVVGETGSGKSTFAQLLVRLADPTGGEVLIADTDLRSVAPASRRRAIRMVPQDGFLFDASIADNVSFGRPDADRDDVARAFEQLGLTPWVESMRNGLDTMVGERGGDLSVGERQLVALARAELADPGLLILDEATSSVDPETEQALAIAMERLSQGRTTISIAHRLSTAEAADMVLLFDQGRIVEAGSHEELVGAGGPYSDLHASWVGNTQSDEHVSAE